MISEETVRKAVKELLLRAETKLPADVKKALQNAYNAETEETAKMQLRAILENIELAEKTKTPMCQDTGIPIFYVSVGRGGGVDPNKLEDAIRKGVAEATKTIPLRANVVNPITRENPGANVGERMPFINYKCTEKEYLEISVFPKGAGSENMSTLAMLNPSDGLKGIKSFVLRTVVSAGGKPCPPTIIGVGIGGSADISMKIAKEALMRPLDKRNADKTLASLEVELTEAINSTGIGPMGLGGKTACLGVNVERAFCHTASLPIALNVQCWAARRASARIDRKGKITHLR
jgi:fumarate hydratase subunit alpha